MYWYKCPPISEQEQTDWNLQSTEGMTNDTLHPCLVNNMKGLPYTAPVHWEIKSLTPVKDQSNYYNVHVSQNIVKHETV